MDLYANMKKEYVEGMTINRFEDMEVGMHDLNVWLYNRHAESALPLVTRIFEASDVTPMGLKSLTTFLKDYTDRLTSLHSRYKLLLENARETQDIMSRLSV
jgi:hypothetical protein